MTDVYKNVITAEGLRLNPRACRKMRALKGKGSPGVREERERMHRVESCAVRPTGSLHGRDLQVKSLERCEKWDLEEERPTRSGVNA